MHFRESARTSFETKSRVLIPKPKGHETTSLDRDVSSGRKEADCTCPAYRKTSNPLKEETLRDESNNKWHSSPARQCSKKKNQIYLRAGKNRERKTVKRKDGFSPPPILRGLFSFYFSYIHQFWPFFSYSGALYIYFALFISAGVGGSRDMSIFLIFPKHWVQTLRRHCVSLFSGDGGKIREIDARETKFSANLKPCCARIPRRSEKRLFIKFQDKTWKWKRSFVYVIMDTFWYMEDVWGADRGRPLSANRIISRQ